MRLTQILWLCAGLMVVCTGRAEPPVPAEPPAPARKSGFNVMEYRIEGNKMLSATRIEEAVTPYLGENKTIADVEGARSALEKAYRDAGYLTVLVDIPEQTITKGIVRLRVAEGSVEKLRVVGSHYYDLGRIQSKVSELGQGSVPYFPGVQTQMGDANRAADLRVTPVLRPGQAPGKVAVDLRVEDKLPLHGSLELNNYAGPNTKPLRLSGMLRYDNLWQKEHSLSLQYQTTPQQWDQVKVLAATYLAPLSNASQLALYAVSSNSKVAAVGDMTMLGKGKIYGARWVLPLQPGQGLYHSVTLGVDYKDFKDDQAVGGTSTDSLPISYIPFSVGYNAGMPDDDGITTANITLNFNVRGLHDKTVDCYGQTVTQFECKRYNAKSNYFYLRGGIDRTRKLPWNMSLYAKLDGQITGGPLISNEQFVAGGADSVRGYMEAEQAGDDGARGTLELRSPQWGEGSVDDLRALAFFDTAHLRIREALPGQTESSNLTSYGVGLRSQAWSSLNVRLDVGWPRKSTLYTTKGKARVGFKASLAF